ncbi:MAG: cytochrome c [Ectothiorhodospiraceae bacterium]|nr:cytochrome c [Ectothiorhodospiraceae bacterium]
MIRATFTASALLVAGLAMGYTASATADDIERGERLSSSCVACHGPGGNSHIPAMYPSLAGRDAGELATLLAAYRDGDIQDSQMTPQATHLSDEDIVDLAAYFAAQEPK